MRDGFMPAIAWSNSKLVFSCGRSWLSVSDDTGRKLLGLRGAASMEWLQGSIRKVGITAGFGVLAECRLTGAKMGKHQGETFLELGDRQVFIDPPILRELADWLELADSDSGRLDAAGSLEISSYHGGIALKINDPVKRSGRWLRLDYDESEALLGGLLDTIATPQHPRAGRRSIQVPIGTYELEISALGGIDCTLRCDEAGVDIGFGRVILARLAARIDTLINNPKRSAMS